MSSPDAVTWHVKPALSAWATSAGLASACRAPPRAHGQPGYALGHVWTPLAIGQRCSAWSMPAARRTSCPRARTHTEASRLSRAAYAGAGRARAWRRSSADAPGMPSATQPGGLNARPPSSTRARPCSVHLRPRGVRWQPAPASPEAGPCSVAAEAAGVRDRAPSTGACMARAEASRRTGARLRSSAGAAGTARRAAHRPARRSALPPRRQRARLTVGDVLRAAGRGTRRGVRGAAGATGGAPRVGRVGQPDERADAQLARAHVEAGQQQRERHVPARQHVRQVLRRARTARWGCARVARRWSSRVARRWSSRVARSWPSSELLRRLAAPQRMRRRRPTSCRSLARAVLCKDV
jgi:hypothetical protein